MTRRRKTVNANVIIDEANKVFKESLPNFKDGRTAIQIFVTTLLLDAGQYKGFNYLTAEALPEGYEPGMIFDESPARAHKFPDPSRIFFYK